MDICVIESHLIQFLDAIGHICPKWAVSLVIADGHFNVPASVYTGMANVHTCYPRGLQSRICDHKNHMDILWLPWLHTS